VAIGQRRRSDLRRGDAHHCDNPVLNGCKFWPAVAGILSAAPAGADNVCGQTGGLRHRLVSVVPPAQPKDGLSNA